MSLIVRECSGECITVLDLRHKLELEEAKVKALRRQLMGGTHVKECPQCGAGLIILTTMNKRICDCGYQEAHKLKKGQKSLLVEGLIGE